MNIWTIVIGEPSPVDGPGVRLYRTGILSKTLAARNHNVTWWDSTFDHTSKTRRFHKTTIHELKNWETLIFLNSPGYTHNKSLKRVYHHMAVAREFTRTAPEMPPPDVIVCSYPPMEIAAAVRKFAVARGIPFILDFRDMWPDIIAEMAPRVLRPLIQAGMLPWYLSLRRSVRAAAGITGISAPFLEWGCKSGGREKGNLDRVFHLANERIEFNSEDLVASREFWHEMGVDGTKLIAAFSGSLNTRIDMGTVIRAARQLTSREKEHIQLVICGTGEGEPKLHELAGNEPHIIFAGWRNQAELQVLLEQAAVGLLPYPSHPDFRMSFPNKVSEYLSWELPIVTCLKGEVFRLISEGDCGYAYTEYNPQSLTSVLKKLIGDHETLKIKRRNAKAAYDRFFCSVKIYSEYADYVELVAHTSKTIPSE